MIVYKNFNFAVIYRVLNVPSIIPLGKIRLAPSEGHFCEAESGKKLLTFFAICEALQNIFLFILRFASHPKYFYFRKDVQPREYARTLKMQLELFPAEHYWPAGVARATFQ